MHYLWHHYRWIRRRGHAYDEAFVNVSQLHITYYQWSQSHSLPKGSFFSCSLQWFGGKIMVVAILIYINDLCREGAVIVFIQCKWLEKSLAGKWCGGARGASVWGMRSGMLIICGSRTANTERWSASQTPPCPPLPWHCRADTHSLPPSLARSFSLSFLSSLFVLPAYQCPLSLTFHLSCVRWCPSPSCSVPFSVLSLS